MSKDYYKILDVKKNASKDEIKRAYRKLAHECHPDKSGGDDKKFKEVNEAYQILSNDAKRQQYDQFGDVFSAYGGQAGFSGQGVNWEDMFSSFGQDPRRQSGFYGRRINLEDLFSDIFGDFFTMGGFTRRRSGRKNFVIDMEINLEDLIKGVEKEIRLEDTSIRLKIKTKTPKEVLKEIKRILKKAKKEKKWD